MSTYRGIAVLSSPRPWIDVFALPQTFNMAVTQSDPDPKVRKMSITVMTVRPQSWACGHGTEKLLILKKLFSIWLFSDIFRYDSPKKCPTNLYAVNLWLKPVSATGTNRGTAPCAWPVSTYLIGGLLRVRGLCVRIERLIRVRGLCLRIEGVIRVRGLAVCTYRGTGPYAWRVCAHRETDQCA